MSGGAVQSTNTSLADPTVGRPIVEAANTALAAVTAAGVALNPFETTFLTNMPSDVWADFKQLILGAYAAGKIPELQPLQDGQYSATEGAADPNKVLITLTGPISDAGAKSP